MASNKSFKKKKRNVTNSVSASGRIAGYANSEKMIVLPQQADITAFTKQ